MVHHAQLTAAALCVPTDVVRIEQRELLALRAVCAQLRDLLGREAAEVGQVEGAPGGKMSAMEGEGRGGCRCGTGGGGWCGGRCSAIRHLHIVGRHAERGERGGGGGLYGRNGTDLMRGGWLIGRLLPNEHQTMMRSNPPQQKSSRWERSREGPTERESPGTHAASTHYNSQTPLSRTNQRARDEERGWPKF